MNAKTLKILIGVLVVILLAASGYFLYSIKKGESENVSDYSAVFLDNGQVYFGKIKSCWRGKWLELSDVYYFQTKDAAAGQGQNLGNQDVALVKLGSELHGPTEAMKINRQHVLFTEDLTPDSKVVKAIEGK